MIYFMISLIVFLVLMGVAFAALHCLILLIISLFKGY